MEAGHSVISSESKMRESMRHPTAIQAMTVFQTSPRISTVTDTKGQEMDPQTARREQVSVSWTTWEMPWQSDGCPLTGKQGVEEEEGARA